MESLSSSRGRVGMTTVLTLMLGFAPVADAEAGFLSGVQKQLEENSRKVRDAREDRLRLADEIDSTLILARGLLVEVADGGTGAPESPTLGVDSTGAPTVSDSSRSAADATRRREPPLRPRRARFVRSIEF